MACASMMLRSSERVSAYSGVPLTSNQWVTLPLMQVKMASEGLEIIINRFGDNEMRRGRGGDGIRSENNDDDCGLWRVLSKLVVGKLFC